MKSCATDWLRSNMTPVALRIMCMQTTGGLLRNPRPFLQILQGAFQAVAVPTRHTNQRQIVRTRTEVLSLPFTAGYAGSMSEQMLLLMCFQPYLVQYAAKFRDTTATNDERLHKAGLSTKQSHCTPTFRTLHRNDANTTQNNRCHDTEMKMRWMHVVDVHRCFYSHRTHVH